MRIEQVTVNKLHGTISQTVRLDNDICLLVGINGSGKTSILNAIDWIIRLDIIKLCSNSFEFIEISLLINKNKVVIRATQDQRRLTIMMVAGPIKTAAITVDFRVHPSELRAKLVNEANLQNMYAGLSPEEHERPLWDFILKLDKPVVISLDRVLSAEVGNTRFYFDEEDLERRRRRRKIVRLPIPGEMPDAAESPIDKVKQVLSERYSKYRNAIDLLNERLKAQIVMSAFRDPQITSKGKRQLTTEEVNRLEKKVTDLVSPSTKGQKESMQIAAYFEFAKKYLGNKKAQSRDAEVLSEVFAIHFQQIQALADAFDEFEQESAKSFEFIGRYLQAVNRFLKDSGKELVFNEVLSSVAFKIANQQESDKELRDISYLSSGERQILVLFTFLSFIAQKNSVFIIDEPELSLHPKWQLEFLSSFLELKPQGTQLLIATHSPEIVANYKNHCVILDSRLS